MTKRSARAAWVRRGLALCALVGAAGCTAGPDDRLMSLKEAFQPLALAVAFGGEETVVRVQSIRDHMIRHAPHKQVTSRGAPKEAIGRTPAAACDAMKFLVAYGQVFPDDADARKRKRELADWVRGLQVTDRRKVSFGGVPSTPDLGGDRAEYFYSLDAAICARAFLAAYKASRAPSDRETAARFGAFLMRAHRQHGAYVGRNRPAAVCEYLHDAPRRSAWDCDAYVKNIAAAPVLRDLAVETGDPAMGRAASDIRTYLTPGLEGFWEYAEANICRSSRPCAPRWRRVDGSDGAPDVFVYGDTVAYALRGLYDLDGATPLVRRVYNDVATLQAPTGEPSRFDPTLALPGYIKVEKNAADGFSGYYDLVTAGILYDLRLQINPDHARRAPDILAALPLAANRIEWGLAYNKRRFVGGHIDTTTLSELGQMLLRMASAPDRLVRVSGPAVTDARAFSTQSQ